MALEYEVGLRALFLIIKIDSVVISWALLL